MMSVILCGYLGFAYLHISMGKWPVVTSLPMPAFARFFQQVGTSGENFNLSYMWFLCMYSLNLLYFDSALQENFMDPPT